MTPCDEQSLVSVMMNKNDGDNGSSTLATACCESGADRSGALRLPPSTVSLSDLMTSYDGLVLYLNTTVRIDGEGQPERATTTTLPHKSSETEDSTTPIRSLTTLLPFYRTLRLICSILMAILKAASETQDNLPHAGKGVITDATSNCHQTYTTNATEHRIASRLIRTARQCMEVEHLLFGWGMNKPVSEGVEASFTKNDAESRSDHGNPLTPIIPIRLQPVEMIGETPHWKWRRTIDDTLCDCIGDATIKSLDSTFPEEMVALHDLSKESLALEEAELLHMANTPIPNLEKLDHTNHAGRSNGRKRRRG